MAGVKIKIEGLNKLKKDLKTAERKIKQVLSEELRSAAAEIQNRAVQAAPVNKLIGQGGSLKSSIQVEGMMLSWSVYVDVFYAPYVEFGTGQFARNTVQSLPSDWQKHAAEFFVNGKGRQPAQPFFYPAVRAVQKTLQEKVDKAIQIELNKI